MKKLSTLFAALSLSACMLNAQNDVTATYLTNAGFDENYNFTVAATFNEIKGDQVLDVYGWKKGTVGTYTVAGTVELGTQDLRINNSNPIPVKGYNNSTGGVLALTTGWGTTLAYYQEVTLPAGKYELSTVWYNAGTATAGTSLLGWIPEVGDAVMSTVKSYTLGAWVEEKVTFTILNDNTKGKIQIGYQAAEGTKSDNSAKLLFDYVKLFSYTVDKTALTAIIEEAKTLSNADDTTPGAKNYLEGIIADAELVADKADATLLEVLTAIETVETAIALCADVSLADLKIDGTTVTGFAADVLEYSYYISPGDEPLVTSTATGAVAGATVAITKDEADANISIITVTAAAGDGKQVYKIVFKPNYMAGWDANGAIDKTPYDAGWRCTDTKVTWADSDPIDASTYQYRDNLKVGRVFIHPQNHAVFSYPVTLEKAKAYVLTCSSAKMSGNNTRPTTFSVNTKADGTGVVLGSSTQSVAKWESYTNHTVSLVAPADGTFYVLWQTEASDGDRSLAWGFMLVQGGEALEITFDADGGSPAPDPQYLALGSKIVEPETAPAKDGFVFDGWWYEEDGFPMRWNFDMGIEGSVALFANWIDPTGVQGKSAESGLVVLSADKGIRVSTPQGAEISVVSAVGQVVKTMAIEAGETFIGLPAGMYLVNGNKVIVK